jgi:uncharacterized secreted repeat protein (TIGR03808 family)
MYLDRRSMMTGLSAAAAAAASSPASAQTKSTRIKDLPAAIEKAIQGSGVLDLGSETIVTETIAIGRALTIRGVPGRSVLQSKSGRPVFKITGVEPVNLIGISFDGGGLGGEDALVFAGQAADVTISGCRFRNTKGSGVQFENSAARIEGSRFETIDKSGIFTRDGKGVLISGNTLTDIGNNAIQVWTSEPNEDGTIVCNNRIARVAFTDGGTGQNGNGIIIFRAGNVIVEGNRISDCAFTAVRNNSGAACQIVNNNISRMGEVAIYCEFAFEGAVVSGNIIEDTGLGISVTNFDYKGRLATVANNVVRRCKGPGVLKETSGTGIHCEGDATVTGNVVEETRDSGISLGWGPHSRTLTATGNIVRDARIGIRFSMTEGADKVLIANNRISGAKDSNIAGYDHSNAVTADLALPDARMPEGVIIRDNLIG